MRVTLIILTIFFGTTLHSQSIERYSLNAGGSTHYSKEAKLSSSFGQSAITTLRNNNIIITQGFQQSDKLSTSISNPNTLIDIAVYPNPTSEVLIIKIDIYKVNKSLKWLVINDLGQQINHGSIQLGTTEIDVTNLSNGNYFLQIVDTKNNQPLGIAKFSKL
jgi:Secretion system C-terminal sorting domain